MSHVRSLMNKLDDLELVVSASREVDFVCLTESWLNESVLDSMIQLNKLSVHRMDRSCRIGGGVCVYVKNHIDVRFYPVDHPS